jgi:hypothetical protein
VKDGRYIAEAIVFWWGWIGMSGKSVCERRLD